MNDRVVLSNRGERSTATRVEPRPGRHRWTLLLGLLGLAGGASLGWMSKAPLYRAEALVYIQPSMPSPQDPTGKNVLAMFEGFVAYQVQLLESQRAAQGALETVAWQDTGKGTSPEALTAFLERRSILHDKGTQHIRIRFVDEKPDGALAGVRALTEAYEVISTKDNVLDDRLNYATSQADALAAQIREAQDERQKAAASAQLEKMKELKDQLSAQLVGTGRIQIVDKGMLPPSPSQDSRQRFAGLYGALGGAVGALVGLLLSRRNGESLKVTVTQPVVGGSVP